MRKWKENPYVMLPLLFVAGWLLNTIAELTGKNELVLCLIPVFSVCFCAVYSFLFKEKKILLTDWILFFSVIIGLVFIIRLPYSFSWHDLASYNNFSGESKPDGHLGFIYALVHNDPVIFENPTQDGYSIFYNPPFYHILQAVWMKLNLLLGFQENVCLENLQVFTWICSCAFVFLVRDLLRSAGLTEKQTAVGLGFTSAFPMVYILGATLNNDILTCVLILACILFTVRWSTSHRIGDIIGIALTLGLSMATKLNAAFLIPCIAYVFVCVFFREKQLRKQLIPEFAVFLLLSVPVAVAWPLFHALKYNMPLNYVRLPAEAGSVAACSLWQRFGYPGWFARRGLFFRVDTRYNHNLWMQLLGTSLFDEMNFFAEETPMWYVAYWAANIEVILILSGTLALILKQKKIRLNITARVFMIMYQVVYCVSYLSFCLKYPYMCSMNARYLIMMLPFVSLGLGLLSEKKKMRTLYWVLIALFALLCCACWGVYFANHIFIE